MKMEEKRETKICVVGLGYVGLPLAVKFGQTGLKTYGLDLNSQKIEELKNNHDSMNEVEQEELIRTNVHYTTNPEIIAMANFIIVAVPTPVNKAKQPDISLLKKASKMIGENLQKGSVVVFESTVYPGCTEEDCVPIIEQYSSLKCGKEWSIGYSPERINPGDKEHTIDKIVKVVSGQDEKTLDKVAKTYELVVTAGVHRASSIKVAEAAKIIENTQRDVNIALMNELAEIFDKMEINTKEVLVAAGTKWNFLRFSPGLVGGHCIGVDPYYLTYKAEMLGVHPHLIQTSRKVNDDMPFWIASKIVKMLISQEKAVKKSKMLILGLTFKENVNDMRNSKAKDLIEELREYDIEIDAHDPYLTNEEVQKVFKVKNIQKEEFSKHQEQYDGIILATSHREFENMNLKKMRELCKSSPIFYDIRNMLSKEDIEKAGFVYKGL